MPLVVGEVFAGYTIMRVLGAGAMGTVYLVQHPRLPRQDALKVLSADLTTDHEYRARFLREADIAAGLSHPNILGIHDRGESGDRFWIAIDFVRGTDAAKLLRENYPRGMPVGLAMPIIAAVGSALDYAHQCGLLHRDVKPANILISDPGSESQRVFLADFGIARRVDDTGLTATNIAVGTVAYAAPEQLMGKHIDARADQYALACTAFHLLTGVVPYDDPSAAAVIAKHMMSPPPTIGERRPELAPLQPVFTRAMAKEPSERFVRCQDFTHALQRALDAGATRWAPQPPRPQDTMLAPGVVYCPNAPYPPTQAAPSPPIPPVLSQPFVPPAPVRRRPRAGVVVAALVAVALLIAGGVFAVGKFTGHRNAPVAAPQSSAPPNSTAPNSGPFTGTYRGDYGPLATIDSSAPVQGAAPSTITWGVRSVCRPTRCVATASRLSGAVPALQTMVFDDVGGGWLAVGLSTDMCLDVQSEYWVAMILQPRPDGTLAGDVSKASANGCGFHKTVTFTRTGDVDVNGVADPANQPPRVMSPAEALRGRYHEKRTAAGKNVVEDDLAVRTDCLRTGDRCMSAFHAQPTGFQPMVFSNGSWTLATLVDQKCPSGDMSHVKRNAQYPLPQPAQNPITLLTGHGRQEQTGSCALSVDFDETLSRTGD